jgi:hypothetical protein
MKNDCKIIRVKPTPIVDAQPGIARSVYNRIIITVRIPKKESKINVPKKIRSLTETTSRYTEMELIP